MRNNGAIAARIKEKKSGKQEAGKGKPVRTGIAGKAVSSNRLELLITVVERSKAEYYIDLIQSFDVNLQVTAMAHGTADEKMLRLLGVGSDKAVIFSVIQESKKQELFNALSDKFKTIKNGGGIACTVPFSSVIGTLIFGFLSDNKLAVKEEKDNGQ